MARIINRHRGLGDDGPPRRWLRRHEQAHPDELESRDEYDDRYYYDDYWDRFDDATSFDFLMQRMSTELMWANPPRVPWKPAASEPSPSIAAADLPDALFEHVQRLQSDAGPAYLVDDWAQRARIDLAVAREQLPALAQWCAKRPGPAFMTLLLAPFWIRRPHEWAPPASDDLDDLGRALVEHLLVRYPVPGVLHGPWSSRVWPRLKWVVWLVVLGQGASMKRAAARFGWDIAGAFVHQLAQVQPTLGILEAVISAEVGRLGGNAVDCRRILSHQAYAIDPTAGAPSLHDDEPAEPGGSHLVEFWRATASWLIRHRDQLTDAQATSILDWAMHRHTEDAAHDRAGADRFSWRGRTPAPTLEAAHEYAQQRVQSTRRLLRPSLRWNPRGWNWAAPAGTPAWSVHELTTSEALAAETQAMRHCVYSYDYKCAQGTAAIFSLCFGGERRATIEVEPRTRRVVQARGVANRACTDEELRVLQRWLAETTPQG